MCSLILLPKSGFGVKLFSYLGCKTGWTAKLVHELEEFYGEVLALFTRNLGSNDHVFKNYAKMGKVSCYLLRVSSKLEFFEICFSLYQRSDL